MASSNVQVCSYQPLPHELGYYESLFLAADVARNGQLNGREAVDFLSRSKLPVDLLKHIWTIADRNPQTNYLDKSKFFVSVRLIQCYQNGQTANGPTLEVDSNVLMRPPYFEGVTGVNAQPFVSLPSNPNPNTNGVPTSNPSTPARRLSIPQQPLNLTQPSPHTIPKTPPPQHQPPPPPQQQRALASQDPYAMLPAEQVRYEDLFPQYANDNFVYGKQAVELFSKSGLGKEILRDIWNLVDNPVDNRLSKVEFAIAMHLIICVSKKNLPLPKLLPPSLMEVKDGDVNGMGNIGIGMGQGPPSATSTVMPTSLTTSPHGMSNPAGNQSQQPTQPQQPPQQQPQPMPQQQPQTQTMGLPQPRMSISDAFNDLSPVESPPLSPSTVDKPALQLPSQQLQHQHQQQPQLQQPQLQQPQLQHQQQQQQQPQSPPQGQPYSQPPQPESAQPPPEISINDDTKFHTTSPALSSLPQNSVVPELPNLGTRATSPYTGEGGMADLENCRAVLQKLQAENISLKAQLGQFTDEERKVQQVIKQTVTEIGSLSQELTGLRNQVVEAKASLIEATSELKAHIEKRDTLKELVLEASATKASLETSLLCIRDAQETANAKAQVLPGDSENVASDFFVFDTGVHSSNSTNRSVNNDGYVDVPYYNNEIPTNQHTEESTNYASHVPQPGFDGGVGAYPNSQPQVAAAASNASVPPAVAEERSNMIQKELEQLITNLKTAEIDAKSASDLTHAISVQLDGLHEYMEQLEDIVSEKKTQLEVKRKSFIRGSNKALKREIETAEQEVFEKKNVITEAETFHASSQNEAEKLKKKVEEIRHEIEVRKSILSQQEETIPRATLNTVAQHGGEGKSEPIRANVSEHVVEEEGKSSRPKSNDSMSTGLSLETEQTSSDIRTNAGESKNPPGSGNHLPNQTYANMPPPLEEPLVSAGNICTGYQEHLPETENYVTERASREFQSTNEQDYPHSGNNSAVQTEHTTEPQSNDTMGNIQTSGDFSSATSLVGLNAPNDLLSQTDGSEYSSIKGGTSASVAPSVASDPGYRYSQPMVQSVDLPGVGGEAYRRVSYGDISTMRYDPAALQEIVENDGVGIASSFEKNELNNLGLINETNKAVDNFGVNNSDATETKDYANGSGVGESNVMYSNTVGSGDISSILFGGDDVMGPSNTDKGSVTLPINDEHGPSNGYSESSGKTGDGLGHSNDLMNKEGTTNFGVSYESGAGIGISESKSTDTSSSNVKMGNTIPYTTEQDQGSFLLPHNNQNYQGAGISMPANNHAIFGNIMTNPSEADQGGIPTPREYDNGAAIAASNNDTPSSFCDISQPKSERVSSPYVYEYDATNSNTFTSHGGSRVSSPSLGFQNTSNAPNYGGMVAMNANENTGPMQTNNESGPSEGIAFGKSDNIRVSSPSLGFHNTSKVPNYGGMVSMNANENTGPMQTNNESGPSEGIAFGQSDNTRVSSPSLGFQNTVPNYGGMVAMNANENTGPMQTNNESGPSEGIAFGQSDNTRVSSPSLGFHNTSNVPNYGGMVAINANENAGPMPMQTNNESGPSEGIAVGPNTVPLGSPILNDKSHSEAGKLECIANMNAMTIDDSYGKIDTMNMKSDENSEDRIPSPIGSYSYDYGNPFLQSI